MICAFAPMSITGGRWRRVGRGPGNAPGSLRSPRRRSQRNIAAAAIGYWLTRGIPMLRGFLLIWGFSTGLPRRDRRYRRPEPQKSLACMIRTRNAGAPYAPQPLDGRMCEPHRDSFQRSDDHTWAAGECWLTKSASQRDLMNLQLIVSPIVAVFLLLVIWNISEPHSSIAEPGSGAQSSKGDKLEVSVGSTKCGASTGCPGGTETADWRF